MPNLNRVFLMGNITRDPELKHTPKGTAVASFGLAINRNFTVEGEKREETTFVDIEAWGRTAEVICEYFKKGKPIFIEGRLKLDQWEKDGQKRSKLSVTVDSFEFVSDGKKSDAPVKSASHAQDSGDDAPL